ncbi:MAG: 4-hydroxy-tetrahydrodipicolinate reductase [Candidatus Kapabacteria bacterium]|nr:4-hydroxy-tetrahydrodipicolinate reductase [Candidatus Kapabacteria bacterium]
MIRLALIGYGSMGQAVERLAPHHGCTVTAIFDEHRPFVEATGGAFDVAIDFTQPDAVLENVRQACALRLPLVIGTTGWYQHVEAVRAMVTAADIGLVYGTNFSIGVHMFLRVVAEAARLVNTQVDYDVMLHEWHHGRKKDSPSGTALTLAETILRHVDRKTGLQTEAIHGTPDASLLHVTSTRGGSVPGTHTVWIDGPFDRLELTHEARSRDGFAGGALQAATWIHDRKGIFDFTDVVSNLLGLP